MKRTLLIFALCIAPSLASADVVIKKAAPVASSSSSGSDTGASLVPSVIGLVSGVMTLNQQQKALTAECIPSGTEIAFIDATMKEWAKTGQTSAEEVFRGRYRCSSAYGYAAQNFADGITPCYNYFADPGDKNMVWENFPKVGMTTVCKKGTGNCIKASDKETVSDAYDIFNLIDFGPADYLPGEATMAAKLLEKTERCSSAKLSAKKRAMWGEFLTNTAGGLGQKTNTGGIMQQIGPMVQSGGGLGGLQSLGGLATGIMNK